MDRADRAGRLGAPFWRLWTSNLVNNVGDGALVVGSSLLATTLTRDPRLVALVSAAAMLPWLLLTLPAGVLNDRVDRLKTVRRTQLLQAAVLVVLTALVVTRRLDVWTLAVLAFLVTAGDVVASNSTQSLLPRLVPRQQLVRANSLLYTGQTIGFSFVGYAAGGLLFATATALPFGVETASFIGSAALLLGLRFESGGGGGSGSGFTASLSEGVRWLVRQRVVRTLALLLGLNNFANQLGLSILALFVLDTLHVPRAAYGLLLAALAVGGVVGAVLAPQLVRRLGDRSALAAALVVNAVVLGLVGATTSGWQVGVLLVLNGSCVSVWNVVAVSMRQSAIPDHLLGRVNSVYRLIGWGAIPVGAITGGFIAQSFGLRVPFFLTGALRLGALALAIPALLPGSRGSKSPR